MKIRTVIIDDEQAMIEVNARLLSEFFPEIELAGTAGSVQAGVDMIKMENPDLVLLDIEISGGTGFDILKQLRPYKFKLVFITGFDSYAINAIRFSAMDYILKPVNENEFKSAIKNAIQQITRDNDSSLQADVLMESYRKEMQSKKLVLKTAESMHIVDIADIIYCMSDNSYTTFFIDGEEKIIVSKSIKEYDELLTDYGFFRPHQSYLVNLKFVKKIDKSDGGFIVLKNKKEIPVSVRQKKHLLKVLEKL